MTRQMPLSFQLREDFTLERFRVGANRELLDRAQRAGNLWIYGADAVGKTHLLQGLCRAAANGVFLPAGEIPPQELDLSGYDMYSPVFIDDVDRWLGDRPAEERVFDLYNGIQAVRGQLIVASRLHPRDAAFAIADLASRLRGVECFELKPLSEDEITRVLIESADRRGLKLTEEVVDYLLARVGRSNRELLRVLDVLDRESLAQSRRVTIPFVREVLF